MISRAMKEVMIDLETLSTRGNATILVIAGIKFVRNGQIPKMNKLLKKHPTDTFVRKIDIKSCEHLGMDIDEKTQKWWSEQPQEIQNEAFGGKRVPIQLALSDFSSWFGDSTTIWSNGATFDIPILANAYRSCGMSEPWKYYNARDTRTIYDLANVKPWDLPKENLHDALYDCWRQIHGVQESYRRIFKSD